MINKDVLPIDTNILKQEMYDVQRTYIKELKAEIKCLKAYIKSEAMEKKK